MTQRYALLFQMQMISFTGHVEIRIRLLIPFRLHSSEFIDGSFKVPIVESIFFFLVWNYVFSLCHICFQWDHQALLFHHFQRSTNLCCEFVLHFCVVFQKVCARVRRIRIIYLPKIFTTFPLATFYIDISLSFACIIFSRFPKILYSQSLI